MNNRTTLAQLREMDVAQAARLPVGHLALLLEAGSRPGVVGAVAAPASYWLWDDVTTITIQPASGGARIVSATELETLNGANLGLLVSPGGVVEVIQHATATANINGTITLSRLLRGRRGTDDAGALASATLRTITAVTPTASYTAAQQTTDGLTPGNPVVLRVFQISATVGRGIQRSATV